MAGLGREHAGSWDAPRSGESSPVKAMAKSGTMGEFVMRLPDINAQAAQKWKASLDDRKTMQQLMRLLAKVPIFADTSEIFRAAICEAVLPVEYHIGQAVFRQGERSDWMGVLLCGKLDRQVKRDGEHGDTKIGEVLPGQIIGDLGLLGIAEIRSVSAVAVVPSTMLVLSRSSFESAITQAGGIENFPLMQEALNMQNMLGDIDSFCQLECFKTLDREFVVALCEHLEPRLCYPNQILMRENAYGNEMYILQAGQVKVEKGGKFIVKLSGGVVLGELAVLGDDKRRTATVVCAGLCLVYVLHGDVFHEVLEHFPTARRIFDHKYIARLVSVELSKVKEELTKYDKFYGSAHPKTYAQVMEQVYGGGVLDEHKAKDTQMTIVDGRMVKKEIQKEAPPPPISRKEAALKALAPKPAHLRPKPWLAASAEASINAQ
eukprot:gnl/TRDRNA2_/TRDRNA2_35612_c0_seq1.p1 gnl/TRDRNA2_/TRDRNA2_35612_c0~~gnl/TRDRNA2_/TRDRNA2_35612_c0_seq1.p1  ORF type:complete len:433 (+),score=105.13 gnl/TRDRNA2_/TRDRNA2_35612_c0_seq1:66-1364(+)